jgi:hypothetical protein
MFCQQDLICELHTNHLTKDPKTPTQSKILLEIISNKNLKPTHTLNLNQQAIQSLELSRPQGINNLQKLDSTQNK